jgi:hypothetical protein
VIVSAMGNDFYARLGDYSGWAAFTGAGRGTAGPRRHLSAGVQRAAFDWLDTRLR